MSIISIINSVIVDDGMCVSDIARAVDRRVFRYEDVMPSALGALLAFIEVKGVAHRASKHRCVDCDSLVKKVREAYKGLVHEFTIECEHRHVVPVAFGVRQEPGYDPARDVFTYVFHLDFATLPS